MEAFEIYNHLKTTGDIVSTKHPSHHWQEFQISVWACRIRVFYYKPRILPGNILGA